ncbi:MAG: formimidoylglutamate deiminase [Phenylobacterium sp. RIFCSPHIGHO2_01_FULL_69_31]|uniref:formimidoylglutamate deiminase n=1 Tax=Phenylobacterium sp. RIFCSPHIGHO2_01_FULL_69_31 TaxID=1801944 RepID=UPI0008C5B9DD|nr:formimidoylglutamate deiminase [Phenylobacterium sp. RIFCSPHIGHO2_01_FULL_69_31]OHB26135.1 MAG: formimidoylglutamate deiminase [Phenylobacterium sp. RIFCSPHIGHO2_01_FULL_69_31]
MADPALWFEHALLPDGWAERVRIETASGAISAIAAGADPQAGDARGGIAAPGLPNLHSHAFQRAMAGLTELRGPEGDSFWTWRELMYRFVADLTPDDVEAIAAQAFVEMLESGFTRVGEFHYLHHGPDGRPYADIGEMAVRIAAAAETTGIGLTLLPVFYAHSGFGGAPPAPGQRRFVNSLEGYARLHEASQAAVAGLPDAVVGVAPHSLRAVTEHELRAVAAIAGPVHIHIAEQVKEVDDCRAWSGARPVEWLQDRFAVDDRWCLVHATHVTEGERCRMASRGAVAGLCPITEANLGDGVFPAARYLAEGGAFGVGSDSNVRIDAAEELRLLEYGQRLTRRARNVLAGREGESTGGRLYRGALVGGGQAVGVPQAPGLAVGATSDIVSFPTGHEAFAARSGDAWLDSRIFAGGPVEHVWRRGVRVVEDGRHVAREPVAARYRAALAGLLGR